MDPETLKNLKEVASTLVPLACCGSLAIGVFTLAGFLRSHFNSQQGLGKSEIAAPIDRIDNSSSNQSPML